MKLPFIRRLQRSALSAATVLVIVALLSSATIWFLSADARREIDRLTVASADRTQWSLGQAEVDYHRLRTTLLEALATTTPDLSEVRLRFDLFYSRVDTIEQADGFKPVLAAPAAETALHEIKDSLQTAISIVDSTDEILLSELQSLLEVTDPVGPALREISVSALQTFADQSVDLRGRVSGALLDLGLISMVLLVTLMCTVAGLAILFRQGRRKTQKIEATQHRMKAIAGTAPDAVIVIERDGTITDFNTAAEVIFQTARSDAVGQLFADVVHPTRDDTLWTPEELAQIDNLGPSRFFARRQDGELFPVEISVSATRYEFQNVLVIYLRDITARVASEAALVKARDQARAGEKAKAHMLAVMSHEIRTPLNGVLGGLDLLSKTSMTEDQKELVATMGISGDLLLGHVNDVLEISQSDSGRATLNESEFDPVDLVETILSGLEIQANEKATALEICVVGTQIGTVRGDAGRLQQVLVNLIGNAIKFTSEGTIKIEIERINSRSMIEFRVIDSGAGIAEEDLDRIFDDFVTLNANYDRQQEGTGLGLGIARRNTELLSGTIGAESVVGEGSLFWVRVPLPSADGTQIGSVARRDVSTTIPPGRDILVVEDNEINRVLLNRMLTAAGCNVTEARDGVEGVEKAQQTPFDAILMDISMPRMDGFAAIEAIKTSGGPNADTPIVAVTAHALPKDKQTFLAAGATAVLTKPISFEALQGVLKGVLPTEPLAAYEVPSNLSEIIRSDLDDGLQKLDELVYEGRPQEAAELAHRMAGTAAIGRRLNIHATLVAFEEAALREDKSVLREELSAVRQAIAAFEVSSEQTAIGPGP